MRTSCCSATNVTGTRHHGRPHKTGGQGGFHWGAVLGKEGAAEWLAIDEAHAGLPRCMGQPLACKRLQ